MRVCELETGSPSHQVQRFQAIPEDRSARTMMIEDFDVAWISSSTGKRRTIENAMIVPPRSTPRKLQKPEKKTAGIGRSVRV